MNPFDAALRWRRSMLSSLADAARALGRGVMAISRNTLALLGLAVLASLILLTSRADVRDRLEVLALGWLQDRHEERSLREGDVLAVVAEPEAVARATAADPKALTREQAAVANWLSRRYKVAPEPISALVQEAWSIGQRAGIDPTLILAVMAVESSFNPFAQSPVGAQGLMQVMTKVHDDKFDAFGGTHAAFDPISNLRVGVQVLKECIARAGNLHDGLKHYVGAALSGQDGGYVGRVLAEQGHLLEVAKGRGVPVTVSNQTAPKEAALPTAPLPTAPPQPAPEAGPVAPERLALAR